MYFWILLLIILLGAYYRFSTTAENFCDPSTGRSKDSGTRVYNVHCGKNLSNKGACFPAQAGSVNEGTPGPGYNGTVSKTQPNYPSAKEVSQIVSADGEASCEAYYVSNDVYYPRYKFWWSHIMDLKTRPPYNRIFPPFWNTWYDPNITSDEYYRRVAADNIMPLGRNACQIKAAHNHNFALRQALKND